ncbi:hypothetical protein HAX54_019997 [Datura stramonium]|uniref:Uncharacterized protein n=1 Tax=Datura stramonium TaxID=4076 RepID=A0ABS8S2D4_DATST|nr:hypothetical protein [Datura stramonium]
MNCHTRLTSSTRHQRWHATRGARQQHSSSTIGATGQDLGAMSCGRHNSSSTMPCAACQACSNDQKSNPTSIRKRSCKSQNKFMKKQRSTLPCQRNQQREAPALAHDQRYEAPTLQRYRRRDTTRPWRDGMREE